MNLLMLTVVDEQGAIHRKVRIAFAEAVAASLSADPETIEELRSALGRFAEPARGEEFFEDWPAGECDEALDGGICIVDLPARLVAGWSRSGFPKRAGRVAFLDGSDAPPLEIPYRLSDDWMISRDVERWRATAKERRDRRAATPPLDARAVLYNKVVDFVAAECLRAAQSKEIDDPIAEIHARWLLTPREDLRGRSPRELLLADRERIDEDLEDRSDQWRRQGRCPPGLNAGAAAYRFGGFGTHENVLYYELVRHLLTACWDRVCQSPASESEEVARLKRIKHQWLHAPQEEELAGYTPAQAIQRERARLPLVASDEHVMADCDCPLCQMMAEDSGPVFWRLNGAHLDDDFTFSLHATREQWEEEQRCWKAMEKELEGGWDRASAGRRCGDGAPPRPAAGFETLDFLSLREDESEAPAIPETAQIEFGLFAIGGCLAELEQELKKSPKSGSRIAALNRHFANLRQAARDQSDSLLAPVAERLGEELQSAFADRPDLAERCAELEDRLKEFVQRRTGWAGED